VKPGACRRDQPEQRDGPREAAETERALGDTIPQKCALRVNFFAFLWLFASAFWWSHEPSQFNNAWLAGMFGCMFASLAEDVPGFRYVNAVLGFWLIASVWVLPAQSVLTLWTSTVVGIVVQVALLASVERPPSSSTQVDSTRRP
jgi:hypothetical protein